jgi:hypothetical protein
MLEAYVKSLGKLIYNSKELSVEFMEKIGFDSVTVAILDKAISREACNEVAKQLMQSPYKFKKNKWSAQAIGDIFNKEIPIEKFDWLGAMGGYNKNWLTTITGKDGLIVAEFKRTTEYTEEYDDVLGKVQNMTSADRFSINQKIVNMVVEADPWELKAYSRSVKEFAYIGTNPATRELDRFKEVTAKKALINATSYEPLFEEVVVDSEWDDADGEFLDDDLEDSTVRGIFVNPRTYVEQVVSELSPRKLAHTKDLVRHAKSVKITALNYEDITDPNVDLTAAKERWLIDEITKYKKLRG